MAGVRFASTFVSNSEKFQGYIGHLQLKPKKSGERTAEHNLKESWKELFWCL